MIELKPGQKLMARHLIGYTMGQVESDCIEKGEIVTIDVLQDKEIFTLKEHADRYGPYYLRDFQIVKMVEKRMRNEGQIQHCRELIVHFQKEVNYNTIKLMILEMETTLQKKVIQEEIKKYREIFKDEVYADMLLTFLHTHGIKDEPNA